MPPSVACGCLAAVISSAVQSLGITLQRKSHVLPDTVDSDVSPNHGNFHHHQYRRNLWLAGFLMFIIANVLGSLVQLSTLPLIILSPLQSIGLIFNSIFSCLLLPGECFTRKLALGTVIISVGAFIIAYYGNVAPPPPESAPQDEFNVILAKLARPHFLLWWIFTFIAILAMIRTNAVLSRKIFLLSLHRRSRRALRSTGQNLHKLTFIKGVLFGVISGTLTAHTFLFAKSIVDVLISVLLGKSPSSSSRYTYATTVFLLLLTLSIIAMQLVAFNKGLSHILSSILYPLCFLVYNLVNLFNGILFDELLKLKLISPSQLFMVVAGLLGVLLGVVMISWDGAVKGGDCGARDDEDVALMNGRFPYETVNLRRVASFEKNQLMRIV